MCIRDRVNAYSIINTKFIYEKIHNSNSNSNEWYSTQPTNEQATTAAEINNLSLKTATQTKPFFNTVASTFTVNQCIIDTYSLHRFLNDLDLWSRMKHLSLALYKSFTYLFTYLIYYADPILTSNVTGHHRGPK